MNPDPEDEPSPAPAIGAASALSSSVSVSDPSDGSSLFFSGWSRLGRRKSLEATKATDTQTHRHTDTQTHRHTDTQTHRHTQTDTSQSQPSIEFLAKMKDARIYRAPLHVHVPSANMDEAGFMTSPPFPRPAQPHCRRRFFLWGKGLSQKSCERRSSEDWKETTGFHSVNSTGLQGRCGTWRRHSRAVNCLVLSR